MLTNDRKLYDAFNANDQRFDGRYFVGISSTGIYCRPVCKARQPKFENCTFFRTAAEAEQAGYRPCLLCRPELAPGTSISDAKTKLAHKAAKLLEENCGSGLSIEELSGKLGCTDRHLRRVFTEEYNVNPVQYLQTCRLLLSKSLLTDTQLSVLDVAMSAGFGSLRRFNDVFKKHYKLSPTALRKQIPGRKNQVDSITIRLGYRPPYNWDHIIKFLDIHAITGVETVKNNEYLRTVRLTKADGQDVTGWINISNNTKKNAVNVTMSESLLPVMPQVLTRIRSMFDLSSDPDIIFNALSSMNKIKNNYCIRGTRVPGCFDAFEMSVRTILGQQISMKAASTLAARIVENFGKPIKTEIEGLTHIFPTAKDVLSFEDPIENQFGPLGVIAARSKTIYALAAALANSDIILDASNDPEEEIRKLMSIKGIGGWTAGYIAMRAMEWTDAFLETDAGIKKALEGYTAKEMLGLAEAWRPWRSYATINLWNSL